MQVLRRASVLPHFRACIWGRSRARLYKYLIVIDSDNKILLLKIILGWHVLSEWRFNLLVRERCLLGDLAENNIIIARCK